jgi:hypothetical protein
MTEPALYVTEGEIVRRMGVGIHAGRKAVQAMRLDPKFPPKNIGGKRYWPSVRAFLDIWNGLSVSAPGIAARQEDQNGQTDDDSRYERARLAATEERVGRRMARAAGVSDEGISTIDEATRRIREHADSH